MEPTYQQAYAFDEPPDLPADELNLLLGGKGANLVVMAGQLGLPVPPGFTITTAACREHLAGSWPVGLDEELRRQLDRLGEQVGRRFGDPVDPLLVSVRSGAPVSMPGMMDTILNLGLNEATAEGLARVTGDAAFAADCLRRFRDGYRAVIGSAEVPEDPWTQLRAAIEAVFRSWNSQRAIAYRRREGIPDELATAVTVQAMVFGNRGPASATGVLFTRDPATGEQVLYGDVLFEAQGEEVVAGSAATQPIGALTERLPLVADELHRHAETLERHYADLCDIEFTVEQGRLWLLQVRVGKRSPRAALRMAIEMARDPGFPLSREEAVRRVLPQLVDPPRIFLRDEGAPAPLAVGLPASPGVATGAIVTSSDAAEAEAETGGAVILVRAETSPEDVRGMARSAGVLTSRGGLASHAAVVARGWGIPAVVGATAVVSMEGAIEINGRQLLPGEQLTIDGTSGEIFAGELAGRWEVAPEAATLLGWAAELGIDVPAAGEASEPSADQHSAAAGQATAEDLLRSLLIKGSLGAEAEGAEWEAEGLIGQGLVESVGGDLKLTGEGKLRALELFAADRSLIGEGRCVEYLSAFHQFDGRVKELVTAWQVREVAGEQAFNDHSDAEYDAVILEQLAQLDAELGSWISPLAAKLPRYGIYRARLQHALELARAGDQRYVASPRVESYHTVWFELHEDLIRLAGRKRSDEAAAGRA